jgi:xyloglucan-specific endo-beta-1,4-glucanase
VSRSKVWTAGVVGLVLLIEAVTVSAQPVRAATGSTCPAGLTVTPITAPFSYGGAGEFCWSATELGSYVQSWGADVVQVTGVDETNKYVPTDQMLRDTTGTYYVYYKSSTANGNFSAVGSSGITGCHAEWCSIGQYSSMAFSPYTMFNNVWGATSGQMIQVESPSNWWVNSTFPETSGVKSYPNASLDLTGKTLSNLGTCTSSFNVTPPTSGSWEFAYDLWVPSEVMIWMHKNGNVGPIAQGWNSDGTPIAAATNVTVGGSTWDVYHGGSNVVSLVRQGNIDSGTVDIAAILNWIAAQGWITNTSGLGKFQFGPEITSAPGGLTFTTNSYSMSCGGVVPPTPTPSSTATRTASPTPTATPTATATASRTASPTPTATRTATPAPTGTPTPTPTATPTPSGSTPCSPVSATITAPYSFDGAGTFCWQSTNLGSYVNSWNLASLKINGVDFTNKYVPAGSLPAKINGYWYVSYTGNYAWSHFEAK